MKRSSVPELQSNRHQELVIVNAGFVVSAQPNGEANSWRLPRRSAPRNNSVCKALHATWCNWHSVLLFSLFFFVGCAHLPGKAKTEDALRQRVMQEWDAKVKNDWGTVYDLTTKEFKQQVDKNKYVQGATSRTAAYTIKELKVDSERGQAEAIVSYDPVALGFTFKGATQKEQWLWQDGEWHLNPPVRSNSPFTTTK